VSNYVTLFKQYNINKAKYDASLLVPDSGIPGYDYSYMNPFEKYETSGN
jgi:hypothetical protein